MSNDDYMECYINEALKGNHIGFFHGSFDVVFSELAVQKSEQSSQNNVIYKYSFWENVINGPMISGHWHNGKTYGHLMYVGSPDRWAFNEDEPKGIGFIQYDTDTHRYFYKKILNCIAPQYLTYEVYTNLYHSIDDYNELTEMISSKLREYDSQSYIRVKIRILIYMVDESPDNDTLITSLRHYFINEKRVKIQIKDKVKDKKKTDETKRNKDNKSKYGFINDKSKSAAEIIQQFILEKKNKEIPLEIIDEKIKKYSKEIV
jgi:hypothetical protein